MYATATGDRPFRFFSTATALLALHIGAGVTTTANAQVPPPAVIGGVTRGSTSEISYLGTCSYAGQICDQFLPAPVGAAGGTAYDPINQLVWYTNGSALVSVIPFSGNPCDAYCVGTSPIPNASGLAFDAGTGSLWVLGLAPEIGRCGPTGGDCPSLQTRCSLANVIPAGTVAAGLALSEKRGLLFYSASSGGSAPVNFVFAAPISDPCHPICRIDLGPAFGVPQAEPILGLGYDDGTDQLVVAAGSAGIVRATVAFPGCTATVASLCTGQDVPRFHGLCLQPQPVAVVGQGCSSPPCPSACSGMRLRANDPTLGNLGFRIWNVYGPAGAVALPVVGVGSCGAGVSALCGRFYPNPVPFLLTLPPVVLAGPSTCTGTAVVPMPIPAHEALFGAELCVQLIVGCPQGGLALTNALTIRINGG